MTTWPLTTTSSVPASQSPVRDVMPVVVQAEVNPPPRYTVPSSQPPSPVPSRQENDWDLITSVEDLDAHLPSLLTCQSTQAVHTGNVTTVDVVEAPLVGAGASPTGASIS